MTYAGEVIPISRLFFDDAGPHILTPTDSSSGDSGGTVLAPRDATRIATRIAPRNTPGSHGAGEPSARFTPARGRELHDLLGTSISQLSGVSGVSRKTPAPPPPLAIETLLYRGRAALERALEIRATCRNTGQALTTDAIEELLDLIGLAATD